MGLVGMAFVEGARARINEPLHAALGWAPCVEMELLGSGAGLILRPATHTTPVQKGKQPHPGRESRRIYQRSVMAKRLFLLAGLTSQDGMRRCPAVSVGDEIHLLPSQEATP